MAQLLERKSKHVVVTLGKEPRKIWGKYKRGNALNCELIDTNRLKTQEELGVRGTFVSLLSLRPRLLQVLLRPPNLRL